MRVTLRSFDRRTFLTNRVAPMLFNATLNGFNIGVILSALIGCTPPPGTRPAARHRISTARASFANFIFGVRTGVSPHRHSHVTFLHIYSNGCRGNVGVGRIHLNGSIHVTSTLAFLTKSHRTLRRTCPNSVVNLRGRKAVSVNSDFARNRRLGFANVPRFTPRLFHHIILESPLGSGTLRGNLRRLDRRNTARMFVPRVGGSLVLNTINMLRFRIITRHLGRRCGMRYAFRPISVTAIH